MAIASYFEPQLVPSTNDRCGNTAFSFGGLVTARDFPKGERSVEIVDSRDIEIQYHSYNLQILPSLFALISLKKETLQMLRLLGLSRSMFKGSRYLGYQRTSPLVLVGVFGGYTQSRHVFFF